MKNPLVSVIIPAYNNRNILINTLLSVIDQTYKNLEIIVVDDGSEEDLSMVISEINDHRIHYIKQEHSNANVARNLGIKMSKGKYIAMLDSDDLWLNNHIEDCLMEIDKIGCDGLYSGLYLQDKSGNRRLINSKHKNKDETMIDYLLSTGYGAQTSTLFFKAETLNTILWDPTLRRHQDYDFVIRYSNRFSFYRKEKPTVVYCLGEKKSCIDFFSCIKFINSVKGDISPLLYNKYNLNMLNLARQYNADVNIIHHYQKEATKFKEYLSFQMYISIIDVQDSFLQQWRAKLKYIIAIIGVQF